MTRQLNSSVSHGKIDLLWKDYFKEPYLWQLIQSGSTSEEFAYGTALGSVPVAEFSNPSWVWEELKRRCIEPFTQKNPKGNHDKLMCNEHSKEKFIFLDLLKTCTKRKDLSGGTKVHSDLLKKGLLDKNLYLASTLINMYVKCGVIAKAHQVLEQLPIRDVVTWSALIAGYAQQGHAEKALICFEKMQSEGIFPNAVTFTSILKACGSIGHINKGKQIHEEVVSRGLLEKDILLGTALVDMYAKCGMLERAQQVLEELPFRDVVAWCALIAEYVEHGQAHEAFHCYEQMQSEGLFPDAVTLICILKACGKTRTIEKGKQIHDEIMGRGLLEKHTALGNALVDMYVKCSMLVKAEEVLKQLPFRDAISWNTMIAGYAEHEQGKEALNCFEQMQNDGLPPDVVTYACILKACGSRGAIEKGKQIHDEIVKRGLLEKEIKLGNALVDMYVKCGLLEKGKQVLEELPNRDIISWSTLIAGYAQRNQGYEALECFEKMQTEGISPNMITFICVLKACSCIRDLEKGELIHSEIVNRGLLEKDVVLGTALVDMYAKCGMLTTAQQVLQDLALGNVVSWSTLIAGYVDQERGHDALNCYERMQSQGMTSDVVTFTSVLKACGITGAVDKGIQVHDDIKVRGLLEKDIILGNALVDMYVKCGVLFKAKHVLEELPVQDIIAWNSLISGYALQGQTHEALGCFNQLQNEGLIPDKITFVCLLSACSHSGLFDEAQTFYGHMSKSYGIAPMLEHHTSMVVAFSCAGHFQKAISVMKVMPSCDDSEVWVALLAGCRKWRNVKLGKLVLHQIVQVNYKCAAAYILMADIFAAVGFQSDADKVEEMGHMIGLEGTRK